MKLRVVFDDKDMHKSSIAHAILISGVPVSIEIAQISAGGGWMVLDLKDEMAESFIMALKNFGVMVATQKGGISHNKIECVDCGLCISICQRGVFSFDSSWNLQINWDFCVLCGQCVVFCPQRALSLEK